MRAVPSGQQLKIEGLATLIVPWQRGLILNGVRDRSIGSLIEVMMSFPVP